MDLYHITSVRWNDNMGDKQSEFVIADNIQQVINYLKIDLQDKAIEVTGIIKEVPITKSLCNQ